MAKHYKVGFLYRLNQDIIRNLTSEDLDLFPEKVEKEILEVFGFSVVSKLPQQVSDDCLDMQYEFKRKLSLKDIHTIRDCILSKKDLNNMLELSSGVKLYEWSVIEDSFPYSLFDWLDIH